MTAHTPTESDVTDQPYTAVPAGTVSDTADHQLTLSVDGRLSAAPDGWVAISGRSADEADGRALREFIHPADQVTWDRAWSQLTLHGGTEAEVSVRHRTRLGGYRWIRAHFEAARSTHERPDAVRCYVTDLTDLKNLAAVEEAGLRVTAAVRVAATPEDAATTLLQAMCTGAGWQFGTCWRLDPSDGTLRAVTTWAQHGAVEPTLEIVTHAARFRPGSGLPGRVWQSGQMEWMGNITTDHGFTRVASATANGLYTAVAVPVWVRDEVVGVIELLGHPRQVPDHHTANIVRTVLAAVGQREPGPAPTVVPSVEHSGDPFNSALKLLLAKLEDLVAQSEDVLDRSAGAEESR
ncbi:MAG: GAF domain-containing protein [Chloroflexota bacterium]